MEQYKEAVKALTDEDLRERYRREERELFHGNRHERRKAAALARKHKKNRVPEEPGLRGQTE